MAKSQKRDFSLECDIINDVHRALCFMLQSDRKLHSAQKHIRSGTFVAAAKLDRIS